MNLLALKSTGMGNLGIKSATSRLIFCIIAIAFGSHLVLFLIYAAPYPLELDCRISTRVCTAYSAILSGWGAFFGPSLLSARILSVLSSLVAMVLAARLAVRWSGDEATGVALTLGLILFPPAIYAFALAIPHALLALLTVAAVSDVTLEPERRKDQTIVKVGMICATLPFLDLAGFGICAAIVLIALIEYGLSRSIFLLITVITTGILGLTFFSPLSPFALPPATGLVGVSEVILSPSAFRPFAMLWVALAFSLMALLGSQSLRKLMGPSGLRRSVALFLAFITALGWVVFTHDQSAGNWFAAFTAILVLGLLAAMPMVMWIRLVMPRITSVFVWILLPVIMYSCFWVVLGPIDLQGFPYDRLVFGE